MYYYVEGVSKDYVHYYVEGVSKGYVLLCRECKCACIWKIAWAE